MEFDDESAAYSCSVTITDPDSLSNSVTEGGRSIEVDIYGELCGYSFNYAHLTNVFRHLQWKCGGGNRECLS